MIHAERRPGIDRLVDKIGGANPTWDAAQVLAYAKVLYTSPQIAQRTTGGVYELIPNPDYLGGQSIGTRTELNLVPGVMRCARCDFKLHRMNLNVNVGTVTAGDNKTEPCPNGCGPLWPVTWKQEADDCMKAAEELLDRAVAAEKALEDLRTRLGPKAVAAQPQPHKTKDAALDVLAERQRQISTEGWTPEHDDQHEGGSLAKAAACYALHAAGRDAWCTQSYQSASPPMDGPADEDTLWPWDRRWWKPKSQRADLVRAGALILAEIERLDRAGRVIPADAEVRNGA